jgi:2-succinyl-6-hydroxy-2,4-cyclohexadiene-1-carboxylate synthase
LIFLHGFLGCKEDWEEMIPFFESRYYCIALDLPGHGDTPYCQEILSALKTEILQRGSLQGTEKPILLGYSIGGRIALQLKEIAKALVVLSGHPGLKEQKQKEDRLKSDEIWSAKLLTLPLEAFFAEWYAQPLFHPSLGNPDFLQKIAQRRIKQNPENLSYALLQMSLAHQSYTDDFSCPTLFLHGENDLKYRDLYRALPKTTSVHQIDGCGHAVHIESPAISSKKILNWLELIS